jgi:hypothetical protein
MTDTIDCIQQSTEINPPPRPKANEKRFWLESVKSSMKEIEAWSEGEIQSDDEEAINQVVEACRSGADGYSRAKHLDDRFMWSVDSELVEILESISTYRAHGRAVEEWVQTFDIQPELEVGAKVSYRGHSGTITDVWPKTGNYIVQTDKWVEDNPSQPASCGIVAPYEMVAACRPGEEVNCG